MQDCLGIMTIVLLLIIAVVTSIKRDKNIKILDKDNSNALRGVACLPILLIHIPNTYSNSIQDVVGSFAFVGVTFFFMMSAYGCRVGIELKKNYLKIFWKNRLISLFLPLVILNIINFIAFYIINRRLEFLLLIEVNKYIWATIVAYFVIWTIWRIDKIPYKYKDFVICILFLLLSLITYFTKYKPFFMWTTESIGLIWGILFYRYRKIIEKNIKKNVFKWIPLLLILSLLLGIAYIKFKYIVFVGDYLLRLTLGLVLLLLMIACTINISLNRHCIVKLLGSVSYEIYLGHLIVIDACVVVLAGVKSDIFISIVCLATLVLAFVTKGIVVLIKHNILKERK